MAKSTPMPTEDVLANMASPPKREIALFTPFRYKVKPNLIGYSPLPPCSSAHQPLLGSD
jgi:hypothetical protein